MTDPAIWSPNTLDASWTQISEFSRWLEQRHGLTLADYHQLYQWSIEHTEQFWSDLWDYMDVIAARKGDQVLLRGQTLEAAQWFHEAQLNYAENLLSRGRDKQTALSFWDERGFQKKLSYQQLRAAVARFATALRESGIEPGDRVAGFMPNLPETVIAMLGSAAIGAIWSSCSPDFGVTGALDRFGQIAPKVLICADGYQYNGKTLNSLERIEAIAKELPSVEKVVVVPYQAEQPDISYLSKAVLWQDFISNEAQNFSYIPLPFSHPLFILFSSGTTGAPKCIVHGAGGTLLQHLKEHRLHTDLSHKDVLFYYTTCGWMMWNWLIGGLATGATLVLYDGAPTAPDLGHLWTLAEAEGVTVFGTSARYLAAIQKSDFTPKTDFNLSTLRAVLSTGSTLLPDQYDYVYKAIKEDLLLGSISGGTDILSCFALCCPTLPVRRGEIQCRGLGMAVKFFNEAGEAVTSEKGELVCTEPFPSMPIGFWGDEHNEKYHAAYFETFPGVWAHGDYGELTQNSSVILYGRSDTVLNPGGVRIGTAEIYRQVERVQEVEEAVAIGQPWEGTERVLLFVLLKDDKQLDDALTQRIRQTIRDHTTPRHVPAKIIQVADIPRTHSGKISELAVKNCVIGKTIANRHTLANPESLELFSDLAELASS